jgi:hypothetical protein
MENEAGTFIAPRLRCRQQKEVCQSPLLYVLKPNEELAAGTPEQDLHIHEALRNLVHPAR